VWGRNVPADWTQGDPHGLSDHDLLPEPEAGRMTAAKRNVLETGKTENLEIRVPSNDGPHWFDIWIDADMGNDESIRGIVTTAVETPNRKGANRPCKRCFAR
jgi:hypothetical protein